MFLMVAVLYWPGSFAITSDVAVAAMCGRTHGIIAAPGDVTHVWPQTWRVNVLPERTHTKVKDITLRCFVLWCMHCSIHPNGCQMNWKGPMEAASASETSFKFKKSHWEELNKNNTQDIWFPLGQHAYSLDQCLWNCGPQTNRWPAAVRRRFRKKQHCKNCIRHWTNWTAFVGPSTIILWNTLNYCIEQMW